MSKMKKKARQLPGLESKLKPKTLPSPGKPALSQEIIVDSDSCSDEAPTTRTTTKPQQIGVHPPKVNGIGKTLSKTTAGTATKSKNIQNAAPTKVSTGRAALERITSKAQDVELTSGSEESEDEGTDINAAQQRRAAVQEDTTSNDGSASSTESPSENSSQEEEAAASKLSAQPLVSRPKPGQSQLQIVELEATRPFVPPKDFTAVSTTRASALASTSVLHGLQGKQVWHLTAPVGLSLSSLKQLAMAQAMDGEAIISHDGTEYGFLTTGDEEAAEREVLIPGPNGYETISARVSQTFNIREVVSLPKLNLKQPDPYAGSKAAASITRSTVREPRPQVKGLKMRYFPSGVSDHTPTTLGLSDSEDDAPAAQSVNLGNSNDVDVASRPEKRKHGEVHGQAVEKPTKKHKKHGMAEEEQKKARKKAKKEEKKRKWLEGHARAKS